MLSNQTIDRSVMSTGAVPGHQQSPKVSDSEVNLAINRLRTAITRASELHHYLEDQLSDVLSPNTPDELKGEQPSCDSAFASMLNGMAESLEDANYCSNKTLSRIRL